MTKQTNEALIAEARQRRTDHPTQTSDGPLIDRLADRLEGVAKDSSEGQYQHAYWQRRAEDAEREMHARELHHFEEEARSAALAAVVEKVREQVEHTMHPEQDKARCGVCRIESTLAAAPDDVLRERDAAVIEGLAEEIRHKQHAESIRQMLREKARQHREEQDRG